MVQNTRRQEVQRQTFPSSQTQRQIFSIPKGETPITTTQPLSLKEINKDKIISLEQERNAKRDSLKRKLKRTGSRRERRRLEKEIERITRFYAAKIFFLRKGRSQSKRKGTRSSVITKQAEREFQAGKRIIAQKTKLPDGAVQTVTSKGKVTIRENGKTQTFQIPKSQARQFLGKQKLLSQVKDVDNTPWWLQSQNLEATGGYRPMTVDYKNFLLGKKKARRTEEIAAILDKFSGRDKIKEVVKDTRKRLQQEAIQRLSEKRKKSILEKTKNYITTIPANVRAFPSNLKAEIEAVGSKKAFAKQIGSATTNWAWSVVKGLGKTITYVLTGAEYKREGDRLPIQNIIKLLPNTKSRRKTEIWLDNQIKSFRSPKIIKKFNQNFRISGKAIADRDFQTFMIAAGLSVYAVGWVGKILTPVIRVVIAKQVIDTIKKPSGENIGTTIFFVAPSIIRGVGKTGIGRTIREEAFIRKQPKNMQKYIRAVIKSSRAQEKSQPISPKKAKLDFKEVQTLNKQEARALVKTLQTTKSFIFGSVPSRALSGKKTLKPHDVDLATNNIKKFFKVFIASLPKNLRKNYVLRGEKIIRLSNGEALFDVKPISRLIQNKSFLTGKGELPVSGYKNVVKLKKVKGVKLPTITKKAFSDAFQVPTQKLVKIDGIKSIGFGEQTTRKGLGTLQVLIEKNPRRAKDPRAFLISLEVQLKALIQTKGSKNKIKILKNALKILKSKEFATLLESKVSGLNKEFPILKNINVKKLKKIKFRETKSVANKLINLATKLKIRNSRIPFLRESQIPGLTKKLKILQKKPSVIPKASKVPSRVPKRSKVPSRVPKRSKVPSRVPKRSKVPSRIPKPSRIPSRIPKASKVPSRIPLSRRILKQRIIRRTKKEDIKKLKKSIRYIKGRKFSFVSDLYSRFFGIKASKSQKAALLKPGALFSGLEMRRLVK